MSNEELARLIRAEIIKAESALANIDALASTDFRATLNAAALARGEAALARAIKAAAVLHKTAFTASGGIQPKFGGGK